MQFLCDLYATFFHFLCRLASSCWTQMDSVFLLQYTLSQTCLMIMMIDCKQLHTTLNQVEGKLRHIIMEAFWKYVPQDKMENEKDPINSKKVPTMYFNMSNRNEEIWTSKNNIVVHAHLPTFLCYDIFIFTNSSKSFLAGCRCLASLPSNSKFT